MEINEMSKNILLLTTIYPGKGVPVTFTPVVHYFAREWCRMGYCVTVVHNCNYFPKLYYFLPSFVKRWAIRYFGCVLPDIPLKKAEQYILDGVNVVRFPMFKWYPSGKYSQKRIDKQCQAIFSYLENTGFIPKYVISHWINPQIILAAHIKKRYGAKSVLVLHDDGRFLLKLKDREKYIRQVDVWGYRSIDIKDAFEKSFGRMERNFRCFSGIPSSYIEQPIAERKWNGIPRFIYVGYLIDRKHPDILLSAIDKYFGKKDYFLHFVGEGMLKEKLEKEITRRGISLKVHLTGQLCRNEVMKKLDNSDYFIMISHHEVFGLVYLEAMARGCITIASNIGGMVGIIDDGVNGFLCPPGDEEGLISILKKINVLTEKEKKQISENARKTASRYTDYEVAKHYINDVIKL